MDLHSTPADNTRYKHSSGRPSYKEDCQYGDNDDKDSVHIKGIVASKTNVLLQLWQKESPSPMKVYKNKTQLTPIQQQWESDSEKEITIIKGRHLSDVRFKQNDAQHFVDINKGQAEDQFTSEVETAEEQDFVPVSQRRKKRKMKIYSGSSQVHAGSDQPERDHALTATSDSASARSDYSDHDEQGLSQNRFDGKEQQSDDNENEGTEVKEDIHQIEQEKIIDGYKARLREKDNTVFFDLFELLIEKMGMVQHDIKDMKEKQEKVSCQVSKLQSVVRSVKHKSEGIKKEVDEVGSTNLKVIQAVIRKEQEINGIKGSLEKCESWLYKGMMTVSNIDEVKSEDTKQLMYEFLKNKLKIDFEIEIMFAYRLGPKKSSKPRNILFKLYDPTDAQLIYANISKYKDLKNLAGDKYFINEYSTEVTTEQKQRIRDVIMENRRMPVLHQMTMEKKGPSLYVNDECYEKQITPPTLKDMLLMNKMEKKEVNAMELVPGDSERVQTSLFQAFACQVKTLEEVKQCYMKLKMEHGSATHIICGYRIFGIRHHVYQDYSDDGEIGGGRRILGKLKAAGVFNIAVFVTRYKAGGNIGAQCFNIIANLTKKAIKLVPSCINFVREQQSHDRILSEALNNAVRPRRQSRRGFNPNDPRGGARPRCMRRPQQPIQPAHRRRSDP